MTPADAGVEVTFLGVSRRGTPAMQSELDAVCSARVHAPAPRLNPGEADAALAVLADRLVVVLRRHVLGLDCGELGHWELAHISSGNDQAAHARPDTTH